ncbi:hypothetical protein HY418_02425 [Candidatus Kaiserbacteria bacterium]|nr:hypothetical protein [Candidatus Kaiserbacteria bacterium]
MFELSIEPGENGTHSVRAIGEVVGGEEAGFHLVTALEGILIASLREMGAKGDVIERSVDKVRCMGKIPQQNQKLEFSINLRQVKDYHGSKFANADGGVKCDGKTICTVSNLYICIEITSEADKK